MLAVFPSCVNVLVEIELNVQCSRAMRPSAFTSNKFPAEPYVSEVDMVSPTAGRQPTHLASHFFMFSLGNSPHSA